MRRSVAAGAAVMAALSSVLVSSLPASAHAARAPSANVLVFLRPAHAAPGLAPRHATPAERATQHAVEQVAAAVGARVLATSSVPDELFVRTTAAQRRALSEDPLVAAVLPNSEVPGPSPVRVLPRRAAHRHDAAGPGPCGTAAHPEADPEALSAINGADADRDGYDGAGVTVAILGDALSPTNPDLRRNPLYASPTSAAGSAVVVDYADFSGDGPTQFDDGAEAFGDASSIAAQGNVVYDLSKYASFYGDVDPLRAGCDIRITGDAPGASLIALKLFGFSNFAYAEETVQAVNYAVTHGAQVVSESFGFNDFPDTSQDAVRLADSAAVAAGVTVVVSSGDAGPNSTIASPASDPDVLTVGASTTYRAYEQLEMGGINALGGKLGGDDDNISSLSSGGVALDGKTVNLVAPGDLNWAICSTSREFFGCGGQPIELFGGTSESAPLTAGAVADVIQAYEATHGGTAPTPDLVMRVITSATEDVGAPADEQGAGLLDVGAAVSLAASLPGTTATSTPGGILADSTQLDLAGLPGAVVGTTVGFTNTTSAAMTLAVSTRALVPAARESGVARLGHRARGYTLPTFTDDFGTLQVMRRIPIPVTAHTARLQFEATFGGFANQQVSLFDPAGRLAAYSLPQGPGGFADVEAVTKGAGVWTAVVYEPFSQLTDGGTVPWSVTWWQDQQDGTCSPGTLTIAPGDHASCELQVTMPQQGGSSSLAVVATAGKSELTIPVVVTTEIPTSADAPTTFKGVIVGGNGRFGAEAATQSYTFSVPNGQKDLDVGIVLAGTGQSGQGSGDEIDAILVDPNGTVASVGDNALPLSLSRDIQLYAIDPEPGSWQLELVVLQPVDGIHVVMPFTGTIGFNGVSVASTLPDSASASVPSAGATYSVTVHNTGTAPMYLALDPRTQQATTVDPTVSSLGTTLYSFFVPPMTSGLVAEQTSSVPASFELESQDSTTITPEGDTPYVTSSTAPEAPSIADDPPDPVDVGSWLLLPAAIGPFGGITRTRVLTETIELTTPAFDSTVTSDAPDVAEQETYANDSTQIEPGRYLPAGESVTLAVAIRPTAGTGTVVTGTLLVEDVDEEAGVPNVVASIPYEYTAP